MDKEQAKKNKEIEKGIEMHLRKYRTYLAAIRNLEAELEYIMPGLTANYEYREGASGTFVIYSRTEDAVLDRIESAKAIHLNEQKNRLQVIAKAIRTAVETLTPEQQEFVTRRYYEDESYVKIGDEMKCSQSSVFAMRKSALESLKISLLHIVE